MIRYPVTVVALGQSPGHFVCSSGAHCHRSRCMVYVLTWRGFSLYPSIPSPLTTRFAYAWVPFAFMGGGGCYLTAPAFSRNFQFGEMLFSRWFLSKLGRFVATSAPFIFFVVTPRHFDLPLLSEMLYQVGWVRIYLTRHCCLWCISSFSAALSSSMIRSRFVRFLCDHSFAASDIPC